MVCHSWRQRVAGPFSSGDLIEQVIAGKIAAEDLVKQVGGLWVKASDASILHGEFTQKENRQRKLDRLGRFHGIWVSKKALLVGGCVIAIAGLLWVASHRTATDPPQIKPIPRFGSNAKAGWNEVAPHLQKRFPTASVAELKEEYEKAHKRALAENDVGFSSRIEKIWFPEVTLAKKVTLPAFWLEPFITAPTDSA